MCVENAETSIESANHFVEQLEELYRRLGEIARETFHTLGEEQAGFFLNLIEDYFTIRSAIFDVYPINEFVDSLASLYFAGLFKEIYWLELLFFAGNYPMLNRNLRFIWETFFRAYHVDTYTQQAENDPDPPESTLDGKVEWLSQNEGKMFRWDFIESTLRELVPQFKNTEAEEHYHTLWNKLNECVHPSAALLERMTLEESGLLAKDSFDREWALDTIQAATDVFDLVWLVILRQFPKIAGAVKKKDFTSNIG